MGCDIHLFPEYKTKSGAWLDMYLREYGERNYDMFGILAEGVRRNYNVTFDDSEEIPEDEWVNVHEPNGVPDDLSPQARRKLCYYVKRGNIGHAFAETSIDEEKADTMEKNGARYYDEKREWLICPKWHSMSWVTLEEYRFLLDEYMKANKCSLPVSYLALYNYMRTYADRGIDVRLVYWFDN